MKKKLFRPTNPADERSFVGREDMVEHLSACLREEASVAIVGPSGMGKTSLLRALKRKLEEDSTRPLLVYVKCQKEPECTTVADVQHAIVKELATELLTISGHDGDTRADDTNNIFEIARRGTLVDALYKLNKVVFDRNRTTPNAIVLLDDLHLVDKFLSLLERLRACCSDEKRWVTFALSSKEKIEGGLCVDGSVLRDLLEAEYCIGPLTLENTRSLFERAPKHGYEVEDGVADLVHELTKGHPYKLHYVLAAVTAVSNHVTRDSLRAQFDNPRVQEHFRNVLKDDPTINAVLSTSPFGNNTKTPMSLAPPPNWDSMGCGQRIRWLRKRHGWTVKQLGTKLAEVSGKSYSESLLCKWERGDKQKPRDHVLPKLAEVLGVEEVSLRGGPLLWVRLPEVS